MKKIFPGSFLLLAGCCALLSGCTQLPPAHPSPQAPLRTAGGAERPRLVLQITVDQLRGDEPFRYRDRFGPGGFRYLLEGGTWYEAAHHVHSRTVTGVGHTTLATGAYPSRHGLVSESWVDRETGAVAKAFETADYPLIGTSATGAWPGQILTTTFSDELALATAGGAKIFGISVKDRGAVPLAGHGGKAIWFSTSNGSFVSSTYYYAEYPAWLAAFNELRRADHIAPPAWELLYPRPTYLFAQTPHFGPDIGGFGVTFPHPFGPKESPFYYTKLTISPYGDELTGELAEELIRQEGLGDDAVPDYLAISFTSNDIVGHWFGPASLEREDNLLRLDRTLARLFAFVDAEVGLANTLVVLAGDHGVAEVPEYLDTLGIDTGRLTLAATRAAVDAALLARYGRSDLLEAYKFPYFFLNHQAVAGAGLDPAEVERSVAQALATIPGIEFGLPRSELLAGALESDAEFIAQIARNQHPTRSGDVYVVGQAGWQVEDESPPLVPVPQTILNHGSPWTYDTYVPVAFAGWNVKPALVARRIATVDVAATLAACLGTNQPSGAAGTPLAELLAAKAAKATRGDGSWARK